MSNSSSNNKNTYTPIYEGLAGKVGLIAAAVYGAVRRHCELKDGVCHASLVTIGEKIGVDRATVLRNIKKLCEAGYLEDLTPGLRNAPHTYMYTAKSVALCNTSKNESVAESNTPDPTVAQSNSSNPTVAENNTPQVETVAERNSLPQTVAESYLKKEESLNPIELNNSSSSSAHEDEHPVLDLDFAKIAATYDRYFGELDSAVADLVGNYLDDPELAEIAKTYDEKPIDWILGAIQEAKLNKANNPATYFRRTLNDWITRRDRRPAKKANSNGHHPPGQPANKSSPADLHPSLKNNEVYLQLLAEEQARNDKP